MQSPTHSGCSSGFLFLRNRNRYIFFQPCEVPAIFPLINLSFEGSLFFGQSSKPLSSDRLRCEHRRSELHGYLRRTSFVHTRRPWTAWPTSHKANEFSRAALCTACENRVTKIRVWARHQAIFKRYASKLTEDKLNRHKMADVIADGGTASATRVIMYIYIYIYISTHTHTTFLRKSRRISRMTSGGPSKTWNSAESLKILISVNVTDSVSWGRICSDNCTCCHTETEVADRTCCLT